MLIFACFDEIYEENTQYCIITEKSQAKRFQPENSLYMNSYKVAILLLSNENKGNIHSESSNAEMEIIMEKSRQY